MVGFVSRVRHAQFMTTIEAAVVKKPMAAPLNIAQNIRLASESLLWLGERARKR